METLIALSLACFLVCSGNILKDEELYMASCRRDLGMSSGAIPDVALTASSSYDEKSVGPINSRIRQEKNGGAWCPKNPISKDLKEWLQVDLEELKVISLVETQGRFGNGQGQEFAPNFLLEYQRINDSKWIRYKDKKGTQVLKGNSNTYIAELRELRPPIIARRVRFLPWSNHPRMICLRVELYGCQWSDGVVSYSTRQGDKRGPDLDLSDLTYDGVIAEEGGGGHQLTGGLGQLTDLDEGNANFRLDLTGQGRKGFEWVGWKNDSDALPVQIDFRFDRMRNFSSVRIHANNLFSKEVGVFRQVVVLFSLDGVTFPGGGGGGGEGAPYAPSWSTSPCCSPLVYDYTRDSLFETSRHVIIPIPHRIGLALKLIFFFDLRWIMISEIRFDSEIFRGSLSDLMNSSFASSSSSSSSSSSFSPVHPSFERPLPSPGLVLPSSGLVHGTMTTAAADDLHTPFAPQRYSVQVQGHDLGSVKVTVNPKSSDSVQPRHLVDSDARQSSRLLDDGYLGVTVGFVTVFVLLVVALTGFIVFRHRRRHRRFSRGGGGGGGLKSDLTQVNRLNFKLPLNQPNPPHGKLSKGNVYKSIATNEVTECVVKESVASGNRRASGFCVKDGSYNGVSMETIPFYELPHVIMPTGKSFCCELVDPDLDPDLSRELTDVQDYEKYSMMVEGAGDGTGQRLYHHPHHHHHHHHAASPCPFLVEGRQDQSLSSAGLPPLPPRRFLGPPRMMANDPGSGQDPEPETGLAEVCEIQWNSLRFIEKLGDGQFRESYLCESTVDGFKGSDPEDTSEGEGHSESEVIVDRQGHRLVLVKMLRAQSSEQNRLNFYEEMNASLRLKDRNLVRVLGVCSTDFRLPAYVLEYPCHGDLHQFLLNCVPENSIVTGLKHRQPQALSYGSLIYMATQVASGMKYLECLGICHRDLAARNCLVGRHFAVKVADFGVFRYSCSNDYYRLKDGDEWLPLRWASWEGVLLSQFSCKSDVWSFGVTLWEVMGMARTRPYQELTDEQVVAVYSRLLATDSVHQFLGQPINCPKEIYDLMKECWNTNDTKRPTFREMHMFLQQKNAGYDPTEQ